MKGNNKVLFFALCFSIILNLILITSINSICNNRSSCAIHHSIYDDDKLISQNYSFADHPFDEIKLKVAGIMEVQVTQQPNTANASITLRKNLLQYIDVYVSGKTLYIEKKTNFKFHSKENVKIIVNTNNLKSVVTDGCAESIVNNIDTDNFSYKIYGSGRTILQGKTQKLYTEIEGSGEIDAKNIVAEDIQASIEGSGNIIINAAKTINARIEGSGNIDYYGTPVKVDFKNSGAGTIRPAGL